MPNQEIGVQSIFETGQFTRGLNRYLAGLKQATTATTAATTQINSFGAVTHQVLLQILQTARATSQSINQVTAAMRAANAAAAASRVPRRVSNAGNTLATAGGAAGTQSAAQIRQATAATRQYAAATRDAKGEVRGLTTASGALAVAIGTLAANAISTGVRSFFAMGRSILETVTFFERLDISIQFFSAQAARAADASLTYEQALAATTDQARALSYWLQQLAVASPFTTREVGTVFRTAQAYGLTRQEAELLTPLLLDFAAATGLTGDVLERLALAFGQVRSRGKLTGEEVRQLGNSGLPIRDILVEALGIANDEFDELLESGALTSDVVLPAIIKALKAFEGAGKRVSFETIGGIVSAFDELREISTGTFFRGVLEPLTEEFQRFFKIANQPQVLAFLRTVGLEIGGNLLAGVKSLTLNLSNLREQWIALNPAMKQQILVFGATFAIVIALAGAIGLLTLAIGVLTNPVVLVATSIAFLVSEYTSGFAVLKSITGEFVGEFLQVPVAIGRGIAAAVRNVGSGVASIGRFFQDLENDMARYGVETVSAFAKGALGAVSAILPIFRQISSIFTFWLAPGSPPRVAPDIDKWGATTMQVYADSFRQGDFIGPMREVQRNIQRAAQPLGRILVPYGQETMQGYADAVASADMIGPINKATGKVGDALASDEVKGAAAEAGIQVSEAYVNSFVKNMRVLIPPMSKELREVMDRIGGGTQLSRSGAFAFNSFLDGFKLADFDILGEATGIVQGVLQSLVDIGELDEIDMTRRLFGSSEDIAAAIEEFRRAGRISEQTFGELRRSAGDAGGFVVDLLKNYQSLAVATDAADAAQKELNLVTEQYRNILKPLKAELDAINETVALQDEEERILSLRRLINNEAVSERRKRNAQSQIDQILAQRRVRNLEDERDTATEAADEVLKAREEERDALQEQFSILQARINAQLEQIGLVAEEGSIIKSLNEEAAKLREKQKTEAELQLELLRLQGEEIDDQIKAARAKYVLDQEDSTELERQQAVLDLQEVAINRRNRLLEAAEFGIPESELTKFRDLAVSLDDIGKKSKEGLGLAGDLSLLNEGLVDVKTITEEIDAATAEVRKRWEEVKAEISATLVEINANLPSFLRILPSEEGGSIPLIDTLMGFGKAILFVAGVMTATKIVKNVVAFGVALRNLFAIISGGAIASGAAGAAGGAAGAAGAGTALADFTGAVVALGAAALVTAGYVLALRKAMQLFGASEEARFEVNTQEIDETIGAAGPGLEKATGNLVEKLDPVTSEAGTRLAENITNAFAFAVQDGLGNEHIIASVGAAIDRSIAEGLVADTPANRASIAAFQTNLATLLAATPPDKPVVINTWQHAAFDTAPPQEVVDQAHSDFGNFLAGITDEEQAGVFAGSIKSLVEDALALGMNDAKIDSLVFGAFNAGVKEGLVADTASNRAAVKQYVDGILSQMQKEAEIESPSKLSQREFGVPWGEGIVEGIRKALGIGPGGSSALRNALNEILTSTKTTSNLIKTALTTNFSSARTSALLSFDELKTGLDTRMVSIKDAVVNSFVLMRTDSETEIGTMRTNVLNLFAGEEDSLLADLRLALIGTDQLVPRQIGLDFMQGISRGIVAGQADLAQAMTQAIGGALTTAAGGLAPLSVTAGGPAAASPLRSRPSTMNQGGVSNVVRTNNFYLTVQTAAQSQGVIQDFNILQTMDS